MFGLRRMLAAVPVGLAAVALAGVALSAPAAGTRGFDDDDDDDRRGSRLTLAIVSPPGGAATNATKLAVQLRVGMLAERRGKRDDDEDDDDDGDRRGGGPLPPALVLLLDGAEAGRKENRKGFRLGTHTVALDLARVPEGRHLLEATAYQQRGRTRRPPLARSGEQVLVVDRTAPSLAITSPSEGIFVADTSLAVRGTASDALAGLASVRCAGAPATVVAGAFLCTPTLVAGTNTVTVRARDLAGNERVATVTVEHVPGGVAGEPTALALDAVADVLTADANTRPDEVGIDAAGLRVSRTKLEIGFAATATVAELNDLLRSIDARIVNSLPNTHVFSVRIPDAGTVAAIQALEARLEADPLIAYATPIGFHVPAVLPPTVDLADPTDVATIDHHLAVRGHAAWNAAARLDGVTAPTLVVGDEFGAGPPDSFFDVDVLDSSDFAVDNPVLNSHGYHVLGVAAARFHSVDADLEARDLATGIYPGTLPLRVVDYQGLLDRDLFDRGLIDAIRATSGDVVLNTSMQSECKTAQQVAENCSAEEAREGGLAWQAKVRGAGLEGRFLHVTSAGNVEVAGDTAARTASNHAASRLFPLTLAGAPVANLSNVLVVENQRASAGEPTRPQCLNANSKRGGDLSAIGTDVWSLTATGARDLSGTSQAAPAVAGLAAYLWALEPGLTPQQLAARLASTARPGSAGAGGGCDAAVPSPSVDAYAALLTADTPDPNLGVRRAILDQDDDDDFDADDVAAYAAAFDAAEGAADYSRHDLNGDGQTGGDSVDRFDLDADTGPDRWSDSQEQTIQTVPVRYTDAALTDLEILCYYAHTDLYTGDTAARDDFAAEHCLALTLETTFPATLVPGTDHELAVRAKRPNGLLQPGVHLTLSPVGGTVADTAGYTDAGGTFRTNARLLDPANEVTIEIVARAGEGGRELGRTTVRANAIRSDVRIFSRRAFATVFLIACDPFQECVNGSRAAHMPGFDLSPFTANVGNTVTKRAVTVSATATNTSLATLAGGVATVSLLGTARSSFSAPSPADQQAIATASSRHEVGFASDSRISYTLSGSARAGEGSGLAGVQIRDQNGIVVVDVTAGAGTSRSVAAAGTLPAGLYHVALFAECASSTRPPLPDCPQSTIDASVQLSA